MTPSPTAPSPTTPSPTTPSPTTPTGDLLACSGDAWEAVLAELTRREHAERALRVSDALATLDAMWTGEPGFARAA